MVESPPLDELAIRKRLVQARMELHRAELALYVENTIAPIRKISSFASQPTVRWGALATMAAMFFAGSRSKKAKNIAGRVSPFFSRTIRSFVTTKVLSFLLNKARSYASQQQSSSAGPSEGSE